MCQASDSGPFWQEVAAVASAVERRYEPVKMNWLSLGNGVPHKAYLRNVQRFRSDLSLHLSL
jgi:hypothetical protein